MPDMSHQRDRVESFARNAPLVSTSGKGKGGVLLARNGKSYIVNVRPPKFKDENKPSQFWKGKIASLEWAQYIADAVLFYCGKPRFHFKNAKFIFPPLACIGTTVGTPERLTTTEQCLKYVQSIAGKDFAPQRKDFFQEVENVIESADFIRQGERFFNLREQRMQNSMVVEETAAFSADEAAGIDDNGDRADRETPMEEDHVGSQLVANLASEFAPSQATVAGFELNLEKLNTDEKSLRSVEQSLGQTYYNPDDCPAALDEGWNKALEELDNWSGTSNSALGASTAAVASTSNAVEVYQEGNENVSPIVYIPPTVFEGVSFLSGTKFVLVTPGEHVLSPDIGRGDSEDMPSLQPAVNCYVQVSSVDYPSRWTPGSPSCQPSLPPVPRRPEVDAALLKLSCELIPRIVVDKVQVQPSLMSGANRVHSCDVDFDSTAAHTTKAEQLKHPKRLRIGD